MLSTHEPAHHASPRGHVLVGDMDVDRVVLLALRIEGVPRPMPGAGRLDRKNKPIADLFSGDAMSDPRVARANRRAAGCDMDSGLAIGARPIAEIRLLGQRDAARADRHERRQMPQPFVTCAHLPDRSPSRLREQPAASIPHVDGHSVQRLTPRINRFTHCQRDIRAASARK